MQNVYLAGRFDRGPELWRLGEGLKAMGYTVTSRWLARSKQKALDISAMDACACAQEDIEDIDNSDTIINFTEDPSVTRYHSGGRHVEFGYGLATGKTLVVVGPRENVFHHLPTVSHYETVEAFVLASAIAQVVERRGFDKADEDRLRTLVAHYA